MQKIKISLKNLAVISVEEICTDNQDVVVFVAK